MADLLTEFLRQLAAEEFKFGETDCAMSLANWVRQAKSFDPGAVLRGRYRTRLGWMRIVKREGGLVSLVDRLALAAGMQPTDAPRRGDIGVVESRTSGPAGAIRLDRGWAMKLNDGLIVSPATMLAAWSF